jgi:hypothetical protein
MIIFSNISPNARCGVPIQLSGFSFRRHDMTRAAPLRTCSVYDLLDFNTGSNYERSLNHRCATQRTESSVLFHAR